MQDTDKINNQEQMMNELSRCKVLVVDDTELNREVLVDSLENEYEVSIATNGQDAIKSIETNQPDIILLDILMPGMDGYEVCGIIKSNTKIKEIPIIFLTALNDIKNKDKAFMLGAVDYITKPFQIREVKSRVKTHLALQYARQQLRDQNVILEEKVEERTKEVVKVNDELKQSLLSSVKILMGLVEGYDSSIGSHSKRTAIIAREIGKIVKLSQDELLNLEIAALLHDIGTLSIPEHVKSSRFKNLTEDEQKIVKHQTVFTQTVLSPAKGFDEAGVLIRSHHEHIDGSGFPDGLKGDEIPLGAKIIGVANAYDMLKYNRRFTTEATSSITIKDESGFDSIDKVAGLYYDKEIVQILKKVVYKINQKNTNEIRINIDNLKPDLILSKEVKAINGKLLMVKGSKLNRFHIEILQSFHKAKLLHNNYIEVCKT